MSVINELAGSGTGLGEAEKIDNAVETGLEELEEAFAGDAAFALGVFEDAAELTLQQAVDITKLLLFVKADRVLREFAAELRAVLARRIRTLFVSLGGAEDRLAKTAADSGGRSGVTSHGKTWYLKWLDLEWAYYTRRRLRGRQPLCGTGVTSMIETISRPIA